MIVSEQRFGKDGHNVVLGRALLSRDFAFVCSSLGLTVSQNDYIGALRTIDARLLRLYVGAYQARLWNTVAEQCDSEALPIVGCSLTIMLRSFLPIFFLVMSYHQHLFSFVNFLG